jgi:hypothetical protein
MWLPLLAALACALPVSPSPAATTAAAARPAGRGDGAGMSLPLDAGPASQLTDWRSLPAPAFTRATDAALDAALASALDEAPLSPGEIECAAAGARAAAPDCGAALASLWSPTFIPRCDVPRPAHGRAGALKRGHGRALHLACAGLRDAPAPLGFDRPPVPHLPAHARLLPPVAAALPAGAAALTPPAPPGRRLDRPPRLTIV